MEELIKAGDVISVKHYSGVSPFKSVIIEVKENLASIKLAKEFAAMNFLEGDPIVFGLEIENKIRIFGCRILKIRPQENIVELEIDKVDENTNMRSYERFPVSLYADLRTRDERKKQLGTVKDISCYGMLVFSKADYLIGERLEVDLYLDKTMLFVKTAIVRKVQSENYYEYGLNIVYEDGAALTAMKDYIKRLVEEQEKIIAKLRL